MSTNLIRNLFVVLALQFGAATFSFGQSYAANSPEQVTLTTEGGIEFKAFVAGPEDSQAGILLAHDWFGASDFYIQAAQKLADLGYRVIAVDYYGEASATSHKEAYRLMQNVNPELVADKIRSGLKALKRSGRKIATFGFSLGTEYAYRAALADTGVDAVVIWYGFTPEVDEDVSPLQGDVLVVLGSLDGPAAAQGASFSQLMDKHGKAGEVYVYPGAHHAFAQPLFNQGTTYDPEATAAAWAMTENFLERKLRVKKPKNELVFGK